jgi:hypothetical protein
MTGSASFGTPLAAVAVDLVSTGYNQVTALAISAQTNVFVSNPPGAGAILPLIVSGTIVIQNNDPIYPLLVYPPIGAQINDLAYYEPFYIPSGVSSVSFVTNNSAGQWYASPPPGTLAISVEIATDPGALIAARIL